MYKKILGFIDKKNRILLLFFLLASVLATILELVSLSSIPIFLMAVLNFDQKDLFFFQYIPFDLKNLDQHTLVLYISLILCSVFLIKNIYLSLLVYFQAIMAKRFSTTIGARAFKYYIEADYNLHVNKNPSIILRTITADTSQTSSLIISYTYIIKELMVLIGIFTMLLIVDVTLSLAIFTFLSFLVIIFFILIKKKIFERAKSIHYLSGQQIKNINQMTSSIKEIKLMNKENYFKKLFFNNIILMEKKRVFNQFFVALPKYYLETIVIFAITLITMFYIYSNKSLDSFIPMLSLLAVSAIRLIPSFNTISLYLTRIKTLRPSFNYLENALSQKNQDIKFKQEISDSINLKKGDIITFKDLSFNYQESNTAIIDNMNTSIELGKTIGLLGSSGAGKTTFIDIFLGLLKPTKGDLFVNKINISNNIRSWQSQLGYVPQEINLIDDSIIKNIALGIAEDDLDLNHFNKICKCVGLDKTILQTRGNEEESIGNRGAKLSGGQIQRIGIARALYSKPKILILDEALNSLDERSENEILYNIKNEDYIESIILISHNLELFKQCDNLILIENGKIKFEGKYSLLQNNENFIKIAKKIKKKEYVN